MPTAFNTSIGLFLLRVVAAGLLIYVHGYGKIVAVLHGQFHFIDPIGISQQASLVLSAFAEGIGAFFVLIGFYTRLSALILIINFVVAYFFAFKEPALLYLLIFAVIFLLGPGKISFDNVS